MQGTDSEKRRTLSRLSALSLAPLLPAALGGVGAAAAATASAIHALPRVALVIGNGGYARAPLRNPAYDADAVAVELKRMGFAVNLRVDARKVEMEEAIGAFGRQLAARKAVGLFYFAGHGLQLNWRNFLLPIDAAPGSADEVPKQTVDLNTVLAGLSKAGGPMNLVILDACRDNPFGSGSKTVKGLSQIDAPLGTLLAYATAPGNVASDGSGSNGLYTENLLREMRAPETKVEDVFKRVRLAVRRSSGGQQIPWESTSLEEDFYFLPPARFVKLSQEELDRQFTAEAAAWKKASAATVPGPLEAYLRNYPSGRFAELASLRLDRVLAQQGEKKVQTVIAAANPYTKGSASSDARYRVGDRFAYRTVDLLTKLETRKFVQRVTAVSDDEVIYNEGALITDKLGNLLKRPDGSRFGPSQFFAGEYAIGKKWSTRYAAEYGDGQKDTVEFDLRVVGRETITVPAGTFDCFRVEAKGWRLNVGQSLQYTYWVAPGQVRRFVAIESVVRNRQGKFTRTDRDELESFTQVG